LEYSEAGLHGMNLQPDIDVPGYGKSKIPATEVYRKVVYVAGGLPLGSETKTGTESGARFESLLHLKTCSDPRSETLVTMASDMQGRTCCDLHRDARWPPSTAE
jgi:hypothetical protein